MPSDAPRDQVSAVLQPTADVALPPPIPSVQAPLPPPTPEHAVPLPVDPSPHGIKVLPAHVPAVLARAATHATKDDKVELILDPAELGKVRFEFLTTNDRLQINLSVERADTLDLLRRHADALRAEFREAGFDGPNLSFSQWNQPGDDAKSAPEQPFDTPTEGLALPEAPHFAPRRNTATGQGLDLRL